MDSLAPLIAAAINAGTPLMLAALGLLINEKSGVVNLGAEGMMLVAAIVGFAVTINVAPTLDWNAYRFTGFRDYARRLAAPQQFCSEW